MSRTRHERGEWRPIFSALYSGADFQHLSPIARAVLLAVKVNLPGWGIGLLPGLAGQAAFWTGFTEEECAEAVRRLCDAGWLELEGGLVWVVRGLEFEPTRNENDYKHRKSLRDYLATLPRLPIVERFSEAYGDKWIRSSDVAQDVKEGQTPARVSADPTQSLHTPPPTPTPNPVTTHSTTARARDGVEVAVREWLPSEYHPDLDRALKACAVPDALLADLDLIRREPKLRGLDPVEGAIAGQALRDCALKRAQPSGMTLVAFIRGSKQSREPPPRRQPRGAEHAPPPGKKLPRLTSTSRPSP